MEVVRRIEQLDGHTLVLKLPESLANHRVEIVVSTVEETALPRRPHPILNGKTKIHGDLFDSAPVSDWDWGAGAPQEPK